MIPAGAWGFRDSIEKVVAAILFCSTVEVTLALRWVGVGIFATFSAFGVGDVTVSTVGRIVSVGGATIGTAGKVVTAGLPHPARNVHNIR
jgi:hypothetical protein